jgi:ribulose-phosphate 3-epimerase
MHELLPAILVHDEASFRERLSVVRDLVPVVHLDVMDGAFVSNRTWFDAAVLASLNTPVRFELHLMVQDPERVIEDTAAIPSVIRYLWHQEVAIHHAQLIETVHAMHKEAGLALNPPTPIDTLVPHIDSLDEILVMGAAPGFSGQTLEPHTIDKARSLHERWPHIPIGFDINVNERTIPALLDAGVTRFCSGGAIFRAEHPERALHSLLELLR